MSVNLCASISLVGKSDMEITVNLQSFMVIAFTCFQMSF